MTSTIHHYFDGLIDPRIDRTKKHPLINILFIAVCAVICGAETWASIERFGKTKKQWLSQFLDLSNEIPSHDTFNRVFAALDIVVFSECFVGWMNLLATRAKEFISIDGKAMRATKNMVDDLGPLYLVNAWCSANQLVLGQVDVDAKSNEITAIPKLLDMLDVKDATITTDAMGCQKEIVKKIREKQAHYVLALKGNQGHCHEEISLFLRTLEHEKVKGNYRYEQTIDGEHGRIETREYWTSDRLNWFEGKSEWKDLTTATMVKSTREINGETSVEYRYYISDHALSESEKTTRAIRSHWQVENCLHWSLDVSFNEDRWRSKLGNCAANIGLINKLALNLLKAEKSVKNGIKTKRLMAGWDENYLMKVLGLAQI
jgi:predicted transposase YbfD/YdcC